jgi:hypothetical protein
VIVRTRAPRDVTDLPWREITAACDAPEGERWVSLETLQEVFAIPSGYGDKAGVEWLGRPLDF